MTIKVLAELVLPSPGVRSHCDQTLPDLPWPYSVHRCPYYSPDTGCALEHLETWTPGKDVVRPQVCIEGDGAVPQDRQPIRLTRGALYYLSRCSA